jgi:hypothetical protein
MLTPAVMAEIHNLYPKHQVASVAVAKLERTVATAKQDYRDVLMVEYVDPRIDLLS